MPSAMAISTSRITPSLWFDDQAEQAVELYTSIFPRSRVGQVLRYDEDAAKVAGRPAGTVMSIDFLLDGQPFTALNGGPIFKFTEAISLMIRCDSQAEVDHYWERLGAGGDPSAQQCGWLKDRFGVSWQVVPAILHELLADPDRARARRATAAMMQMKKLDIAALQQAAAG